MDSPFSPSEPQNITYAQGSSDIIAKLRGTYNSSSTAPGAVVSTDLQRSIFGAPPSAPVGLSLKSTEVMNGSRGGEAQVSQGIKRPRDDEESDGEAPMDEDESDAPMEASSDED